MSIFGKLRDKIFGTNESDNPFSDVSSGSSSGAVPTSAPRVAVDIEAVLERMASDNPQKLNWRTSIVDLMKLVGMDSSLSERKELATELGYTGDMDDSASMNIWLHKTVMRRMAENGGNVPANLLD